MREWMQMRREALGLSENQAARKAKIGNTLWFMLEHGDEITHPVLADKVAKVLHASSAERNSLVAACHRRRERSGEAQKEQEPEKQAPEDGKRPSFSIKPMAAKCAKDKGAEVDGRSLRGRTIVAINADGHEVARFTSINNAANAYDANSGDIFTRCICKMKCGEADRFGVTFRFGDEYDAGRSKPVSTGHARIGRNVVEIDMDGNVIARYAGVCEAARKTGISKHTISNMCRGKQKAMNCGRIFRYAEE